MCMGSEPSKPSKSELEYRAEDDFRTLQRATEVQSDAGRNARAMAHGRKQVVAMAKVMRGAGRKAGRGGRRS